MDLKRLVLVAVVALVAACNKPSEENCRKALTNMQHLLGTEDTTDSIRVDAEVRRCRGASTKESVECAIKASTRDELRQCGFTHIPEPSKK